jgi:hypothetical protein
MSMVISRRDFLKLLGYGAIALSSGLFLQFSRFGDQIEGARRARYDGTSYLGGNDQDICGSMLAPCFRTSDPPESQRRANSRKFFLDPIKCFNVSSYFVIEL